MTDAPCTTAAAATGVTDHRPLILTAMLDHMATAHFEALRRAHFPPDRNEVPAHVTLFHQLPGSAQDAVVTHLQALARAQPAIVVEVAPPRSLGNGVAFDLHSRELAALHAELASHWSGLLIAQDQGRLRAHVTVQNKVSTVVAAATLAQLGDGYTPRRAQVTGVTLWRYLGGPWQHLRDISFRGRRSGGGA